jgi:CDP-glycerol glycerophosphotransferase (TagB/SpsB family)
MRFFNVIFKRFNMIQLIQEILYILVGYMIFFISFLIKRDKKKWVFGYKKQFKDNVKYLYVYLLNNHKEITTIWISSSRSLVKEMRRNDYPVYYKYSLKGLYHCLTAGIYFTVINSNYVNYFTSGGAKRVNLWHGIGIKAMAESKSTPADDSLISRICMPYAYEKYDLFLSTTPLLDQVFKKTFKLSDNQIYHGIYPRCEFMRQDKNLLADYIEMYENSLMRDLIRRMKSFDKVYIYMPTWRLNLGKKFLNYALPDLARVNEVLKKEKALLILKLHGSVSYNTFESDLENVVYMNPNMDLYPVLPFTDVLITDYSSIYYDYLLMEKKGVIIYDFDYESYIEKEFPFYVDFKKYTPGLHVCTFDELIGAFEKNDGFLLDEKSRNWILAEMWGNYKLNSNEKLVEELKNL